MYLKFTFLMGILWAYEADIWRAVQETLSSECAKVPVLHPCPTWITSESLGGEIRGWLLFCKTQWIGKTENACSKVPRSFFDLLLQLQTHSSMGHPNPLALRDKRTSSVFTPEITWIPFCPRQSPYGKRAQARQMWSFQDRHFTCFI